MSAPKWCALALLLTTVGGAYISGGLRRRPAMKTKCPTVRHYRNFDLERLLGAWYVVEYYASSEEALSYRCMRADFSAAGDARPHVTMNFTYSFVDDPRGERLVGNITWSVPDVARPAHWTHSEDTYEGVYNTYVLDSDYDAWALLMHCAEKAGSPRYLSSFIMSRSPSLGVNVVSYLRDKLPRYDVDLAYMFGMAQADCDAPPDTTPRSPPPPPNVQPPGRSKKRRHPLKHRHR